MFGKHPQEEFTVRFIEGEWIVLPMKGIPIIHNGQKRWMFRQVGVAKTKGEAIDIANSLGIYLSSDPN